MLQSGDTVAARYHILRLLGQGGMGAVYLAEDYHSGTSVAIKVILLKPDGSHLRFKREFRFMARLDHPYILKAYDSGVHETTPYLVMEYLKGGTLEHKFPEPVSEAEDLLERLRFLCEISEALSYIHSQGIVHRDLKPDNVMIADNHTRLMDFGLARSDNENTAQITQVGAVMGTASYMSPEQARGIQVDARSDLYALGCLIYWTITAAPPFAGQAFMDVLMRHLRDTPPSLLELNPLAPVGLAKIADRLLEKAPEDRYPAADDVTSALMLVRESVKDSLQTNSSQPPISTSQTISLSAAELYDNRTPANLLNPPLIGRNDELRLLAQSIERPQVYSIEAGKGLGLSSLLHALRREAAHHDYQSMMLNFANYSMVPFGAWREALQECGKHDKQFFAQLEPSLRRQLEPLLPQSQENFSQNPDSMPDDLSRLRFYNAVDSMLQQYHAKHNLLIIAEDIDEADEASIGLLSYLLRAKVASRISFVLGYTSHNLNKELQQTLKSLHTVAVKLEPFDEATMLEYIGALLGGDVETRLQKYVLERADGSPLFAKEILNALLQAGHLSRRAGLWEWSRAHTRLPGGIEDVFGERIASLERSSIKILQAAATIGIRFDFDTLMELNDDDEDALLDALDEALRAKLIDEIGMDSYRFAHPLLRDLLHSNLNPRRRRNYHQQLGDKLTAANAKPEQIADHYAETREPSQALPYAIKAARKALKVFANDISETYYRLALKVMPEDYGDKAQVQLELGQLLDRIGKWDEAQALYEAVRTDEALQGTALYSLGTLAQKRGDLQLAEGLLQEALALTPENTKIHSDLALICSLQGKFAEAEEILYLALSLELAKGNMLNIAERQADLGKLEESRGNYSEAIEWFTTGLQSIEDIVAPNLTATLLNRKGISNYRLGKLKEAQCFLQKSHEIFEEIGDLRQALVVLINQGGVLMDSGQTDNAIDLYQQATLQSFRLGDTLHEAICKGNLGALLMQKGDYQDAINILLDTESKLTTSTSLLYLRIRTKSNLAESYIANNQVEEALKKIAEAKSILAISNHPELELDIKNREVKALFAMNKIEKAEIELTATLQYHHNANYRLILLDSYLLLCIANFANKNLEQYTINYQICKKLAEELHDEIAEWQIKYLQAIVDEDIFLSQEYEQRLLKTTEHLFVNHVNNALAHA